MTRTTIVVGPRTRAGRAVVARAVQAGDDVFVLARHADDSAALSGGDGTVLRIDEGSDLLGLEVFGSGGGAVRIVVCALGPVHPDAVRSSVDARHLQRDLGAIGQLLAAASSREVGVVLISSIIALAPGPERRYYGGFKCLVEQELAGLVARHSPQATFSVVYPGRIVDGPARRLLPGLHTTYRGLAAAVDTLGQSSRARISGIDARLWLVVNSARLLLTAVLPPRASTPTPTLEVSMSTNDWNRRP